jgi:hypothetical protein
MSLSLGEMPEEMKEKIPAEVIFAKTAGEKIDLNINLTVNEQGRPEQNVKIVAGKNIQLIVKPEKEVNGIKGYLVFRSSKLSEGESEIPASPAGRLNPKSETNSNDKISNDLNKKEPQVAGVSDMVISLKDLLGSMVLPLKSLAQTHDPKNIETKLVLAEFEYADPDGDGIYSANIQTPVSEGEYEVITVMDYKDINLGKKEIRLITVVDPEGYIYEKIKNSELRIAGSSVSLYWFNPQGGKAELWPAENFSQKNPQITDATGKYSFLVPPGKYYLEAEVSGYKKFRSENFDVASGGGVHQNIELRKKLSLADFSDWKSIILVLVVLLLGFNFYRDRKNRTIRNI